MSDDWDSVTYLRKKAPTSKDNHSQAAINLAKRSGGDVRVEKKVMIGQNKAHKTDLNSLKLDQEVDVLSHKHVGVDVSKALMRARQELGWTQKELAVKVNEKPQIVAEYEQGKALPNQQILAKLERALGVKLRGKDIGMPLAPPGSKK